MATKIKDKRSFDNCSFFSCLCEAVCQRYSCLAGTNNYRNVMFHCSKISVVNKKQTIRR